MPSPQAYGLPPTEGKRAGIGSSTSVLRVIAEGEPATLGADVNENLCANTLPVTADGRQNGRTAGRLINLPHLVQNQLSRAIPFSCDGLVLNIAL